MPEKWILKQYQALPLKAKVHMSLNRINEWYDHFEGRVCVSFSGGKDSTVLANLVHRMYPNVPLVFANTGLEYPGIQAFAKKMGAEFVRPKMSFSEVISQYGYPVISKKIAEAIFYARKIHGGGTTQEEERITGRETYHQRRSLYGKWGGGCADNHLRGEESQDHPAGQMDGKWANWRRGCL